LERPGVPAALRLLTALAKGDEETASSLVGRPELLHLLHSLEGCSSEKRVGGLAEGLLEVLAQAGGEGTASSVAALRSSTKAEMRERAQRKREEMLASMGMQQVCDPKRHHRQRDTTPFAFAVIGVPVPLKGIRRRLRKEALNYYCTLFNLTLHCLI
jgi:hypothetical protein